MSKLYGTLEGDSGGRATKASNRVITSQVQTQNGRITVTLNAAGDYHIGDSFSDGSYHSGYHGGREIASGNLHAGQSRTREPAGRFRLEDDDHYRSNWAAPLFLAIGLGALLVVTLPPPSPPEVNVTVIETPSGPVLLNG